MKRIRGIVCRIALGVGTLCALLAASSSNSVWSQSRTIRLINPFPAGGTADIIARVVTEQISRTRGATFIIENRPGAGTVIGADVVARAAPDGNTLLINTTALLINAHVRKLSFDPLTSFAPVCNLFQSPQLLVVNSNSSYRSMNDLVAAARAKPNELTVASTGPATNSHIAFEMFRRAASVQMTYVPFPGNLPTVNAVLGEHVTVGIANYADLAGHIQAGKVRALAVVTPTRVQPLSEVPTVREAGFKEFEYLTWFGILAPAKTPTQTIDQLSEWFAAARHAPEVKEKLLVQGLFPESECGSEFAGLLRKTYEDYGRAIREANIKLD